jgi:hypothetical protein
MSRGMNELNNSLFKKSLIFHCFGEKYLLIWDSRVSEARKQHEACSNQIVAACFRLVSCQAYSLTMKMEETLVGFQQTTWHYVPEDKTRHSHPCEKLKSTNIYLYFVLPIYILNSIQRFGPRSMSCPIYIVTE